MKIMHVTKKYPAALGGDAVVVSNLQKHQQVLGDDVVIITSNCEEIMKGKNIYTFGLRDNPARLDSITFKRLVSLLLLFFQIFGILRKEQPDIIHTHSVDMAFCISWAARFYKIPIVHTFHIVTFYDTEQSLLRRNIELLLAKWAKPWRITAPNTYDVQRLQEAGLVQAALLPNGVDMAFWKSTGQKRKAEKFTFMAVGRLEQQKGYEFLVEAARKLRQVSSVAFHIVIIGEGSQKAALQKRINQHNLHKTILLAGRKTPEEVKDLFNKADAAIFPSLYETTPLTLLEAWAVQLPVITTSVGIVRQTPPEFDAAYIVPPKDAIALQNAMLQCMTDDSQRLRITKNGYEEAKKYTWPGIVQTAYALYRSAK